MNKAMSTISALIALAAITSGCTDPTISRAHKAVSAALIDPDSAKFQNDVVVGKSHVCGFVNAKNRMGAYVGNSPYIYSDDVGPDMVSDYPKYHDLQTLDLTNTEDQSWSEQYQDLDRKCRFVEKWNSECGKKLIEAPEEPTRLCAAWKEYKGNIDQTMHFLGVASLRHGYYP